MGTLIVGLIIIAVVTLIVKGMVSNKKKGKSITGCDGECGHCTGHCH